MLISREGINLKIYPEEMSKLGRTSLKMRDGSGYLGVLGVYHELHCVVSITFNVGIDNSESLK